MKSSSTSATANKKRRISHDDDDDHDDDEDENMEKFYALIKSIREARDRSMIVNKGADDDQSETKKRKVVEQVSVWNPSFQREDFMEDDQAKLKKLPSVSLGSTSKSKEGVDVDNKDRKQEVKEELDLNLSL